MNSQFYEFWGSFLSNVAQGQKQVEEMSAWMKQGFAGEDDLSALFRRCYGLNTPDRARDPQAWQEAVAEFRNAFVQFAAQWGWVTRAEHQKVLDEKAALESKVQAQQTTIEQLRGLLTRKGLGHGELLQHMQSSLKDQGDQFQTLMESIRSAFEKVPQKKKKGLP